MLPKYHILSGFVFAYIIYWFSSITIFQTSLIFLASVLIDFDHYIWHIQRKKDWNLKNAYKLHKDISKIKHKPIMHIFHTIEFLFLIIILSLFSNWFLFILIGILFHFFLDIIEMFYNNKLACREFSLIRYFILDKENYF